MSLVTQIAELPKMKLSHNITVTLSVSTQNSTSNIIVILSFKIQSKLSWMNDNQFARCGAKADIFPFNKSPKVENMFSTRTEDALWLSVSLASSCGSGNLLELLRQKESGSSSYPSGSHRMYAFIWSRGLRSGWLRRDGVFLNQFHFLAQRSRWMSKFKFCVVTMQQQRSKIKVYFLVVEWSR